MTFVHVALHNNKQTYKNFSDSPFSMAPKWKKAKRNKKSVIEKNNKKGILGTKVFPQWKLNGLYSKFLKLIFI